MPDENPAALVPETRPTRSRPSRPSRRRPPVLVKPEVTSDEKDDPNAPWVVFWASEDPKLRRVLIGCSRCGCRMSFPNKTAIYKIESALYGFRLDHQSCRPEDKPADIKQIPSST